ncbi:MAG: RnfABCDGE type electron transport complex subunit D [Clostridia bacterium]|nr:RnfABCDGE type electron transport complex subunit D [Clostridia bacterium]
MNNITAPHIRTEAASRHLTRDVLLTTLPLCIFSAVTYGVRPVLIVLFSILSAIVSECVCCLFRRQSMQVIRDGSAAVTGALIGLVMSPMVDYWVPMLGAAFAIIVVKAPFGGYGRNVFNPAAAGIAVLSYCFPQRMFTYPIASSMNPLPTGMSVGDEVVTSLSLAAQLRADATPSITRMQLILGDFAGPIGATATLLLVACAVYLICRGTISCWTVVPYFATCALVAWLFPAAGVSRMYGVLAQVCAGYVLFTGVFLINDTVTTPRFWFARLLYGVSAGVLVMLLQRIGRVECGCCFAILLLNSIAPIMDRWSWYVWRYVTRFLRIRQEVKAHE